MRRVVLVLLCLVTIIVCVGLGLLQLIRFPCSNEIISTVPSPDGQLSAVVFARSCGATTGWSFQVTVLKHGALLPDDGGNVFVADDDHDKDSGGSLPYLGIAVKWAGNRTLLVRRYKMIRVFQAEKHVPVYIGFLRKTDVSVEYKVLNR